MRISALAATLTAVPFLTLPAASLTHPGAAAQAQRQDHQYRESFTTTVIGAPEADTLLIRRNLREVRVRISGLPATIDRARAREILERRVVGQLVTVNVISGDAAAGTELAADVTTGEGRNLGQELLTWMAEPIRPSAPRRAEGDVPTAVEPAPRTSDAPRRGGYPESGLSRPFRLGIGGVGTLYDDEGNTLNPRDFGANIYVLKLDYSYFRPTRHEALLSLAYFNSDRGGGSGLYGITTEYRWRFGGRGAGYYALGGGLGLADGYSNFVATSGLGADFGGFFLEFRNHVFTEGGNYVGFPSFILGGRF